MMTSEDGAVIQIRVSGTPKSSHHEIYKLLGAKDILRRKKTVSSKSL